MPDTEKLKTEQLLESRPRLGEAEVDTYVSDIYNIGDLNVVQHEKRALQQFIWNQKYWKA